MAAVLVEVILPMLPTVILPGTMTALSVEVKPIRNFVNKVLGIKLGTTFFKNASDRAATLQLFLLWFLLIQLIAMPIFAPVGNTPNLRIGKLTCIGLKDIPRIIFLVCMYAVLPLLSVNFFMFLSRSIGGEKTAANEIEMIGFLVGYLLSVFLIQIITPIEILGALIMASFSLISPKVRKSLFGKDNATLRVFVFSVVFIICLLVLIIIDHHSQWYHLHIHGYAETIFGHSGQGTFVDMLFNLVFFFLLPLGIAKSYTKNRKTSQDSSITIGMFTGVIVGIVIQTALPEKLRPTNLLYMAENRINTMISKIPSVAHLIPNEMYLPRFPSPAAAGFPIKTFSPPAQAAAAGRFLPRPPLPLSRAAAAKRFLPRQPLPAATTRSFLPPLPAAR